MCLSIITFIANKGKDEKNKMKADVGSGGKDWIFGFPTVSNRRTNVRRKWMTRNCCVNKTQQKCQLLLKFLAKAYMMAINKVTSIIALVGR